MNGMLGSADRLASDAMTLAPQALSGQSTAARTAFAYPCWQSGSNDVIVRVFLFIDISRCCFHLNEWIDGWEDG